MTDRVGRVAGLNLYPVQSLQGQALRAAEFVATGFTNGLAGDRAFAIADLEEGAIAHASYGNPKWRSLITWRARYVAMPEPGRDLPPVEIAFPDGSTVMSDDSKIDDALGDQGRHRFALVRNDSGRFPPVYRPDPCHILTSATLATLSRAYPEGKFAPERFRPNIFVDTTAATGFVEQEWLGGELGVGGARLAVSDVCKRCALVTRAQGGLSDDKRILQTVTGLNNAIAGVYARIAAPGRVALGDEVHRLA